MVKPANTIEAPEIGGNPFAPLKTFGAMDREDIAKRQAETMSTFSKEDISNEYEKFIHEVNAIVTRGGSIQEISDKLAQYKSLDSQATQLISEIESKNPHLPKTIEDEQELRAEEHRERAELAGSVVAGMMGAGVAITGAQTGSTVSAAIKNMFAGFNGGAGVLLSENERAAETANAIGNNLLSKGLVVEAADLGSVSPLSAERSHGLPAVQKGQSMVSTVG